MDTNQVLSTIALVIIILVIYYTVYLEKQKQQKAIKKMQDTLKKGDKIITFSGLSGEIEEVLEDRIIAKMYPENIKMSIEKWAVAGLDERNIEKSK